MKILKPVPVIEVKRTFVIADSLIHKNHNKRVLTHLSETNFNEKLENAKKDILNMKEEELDRIIKKIWKKRIKAYNHSTWHLAEVSPDEIGVWRRAGELPLDWTNRSLAETADKVSAGLKDKSKLIKKRPKQAIPNILEIKTHLLQKEKYLFPIVFKTDTGTGGRRRLKRKMKGDIDDGCMRSIAMAISGRDPILVYFGMPKK